MSTLFNLPRYIIKNINDSKNEKLNPTLDYQNYEKVYVSKQKCKKKSQQVSIKLAQKYCSLFDFRPHIIKLQFPHV